MTTGPLGSEDERNKVQLRSDAGSVPEATGSHYTLLRAQYRENPKHIQQKTTINIVRLYTDTHGKLGQTGVLFYLDAATSRNG